PTRTPASPSAQRRLLVPADSPAVPPLFTRALSFPSMMRPAPRPTPFPYTTLFRSAFINAAGSAYNWVNAELETKDAGHRHLWSRSEEHTSELQSPCNLVCRLLLEKKQPRRYIG